MLEKLKKDIEGVAFDVIIHRSFLAQKWAVDIVTRIMNECQPKRILEIGTYNGVSALVFESFPFVERVDTIDIMESPIVAVLFKALSKRGAIRAHIADCGRLHKEDIIKHLEFDFAFIDRDHTYDGVSEDIGIIAPRCDTMLFHDAKNAGVERSLKELRGFDIEFDKTFALARRKK